MDPRRTVALVFLVAVVAAVLPGPSVAQSSGQGRGLKLVAELPLPGATLMETATIGGRDYAFVSQIDPGAEKLSVIDITQPERPKIKTDIPCNGNQGNVQVSHDKKTLVIGIDVPSAVGCMPAGSMGFVTVDISNPLRPRPVGYAEIARGSHALATHPTKPFVYNADGFPEAPGQMQVWSIKDPAKPKLVTTLDTGAHSPHDLAFNRTGTMLASANAVNLHLMDTRDPADPKIVHTTQCPGCLHTHEARFTPDSNRLIVNDEYPNSVCPGGAVYFYDVINNGSLMLRGTYTGTEVVTTANNQVATKCTPHVFDINDDGTRMAISWHEGGIKYLDISETTGVTVGSRTLVPGGPTELGWYASTSGFAFSAKFHEGPYVHVIDVNHGYQVFRVTAKG